MANTLVTATRRREWLRLALHYGEMVIAMMVGMMALAPVARWAFGALGWSATLERADVAAMVMAVNMAIGMALWMRFRKHSWISIAEMSAAMIVPFAVLLPPYWAGLLPGEAISAVGHVLMLPAMLVAMLYRRHEYLGHRH